MRYFVMLGAREIPVDVTALPGGGLEVLVDGERVEVDAVTLGETLSLRIDGRVVDLLLDGSLPEVRFRALGSQGTATVESERARSGAGIGRGANAPRKDVVVAPMPGRIVRVLVEAGDSASEGQPLVVIEAMKMENELRASHAARVSAVLVKAGDTVEGGAQLILLE